ncbi:MAG: archaeal preflagellin peptidase FlaK [Thermoplasmata archaeon]|jgi:preflagellin peptidase FlaK|nr:archaeal preflagellin peptidase FlaK [Thermoplasmata archaeon]
MPPEPRLLLAVAMLLGATLLDLRSRRVANLYWFPFIAFALVLDLVDLARGDWLGVAVAAVLCGLFYLFWRFRLFGGADAKGLMVLALLLPATTPPAPVPTVLGGLMLGSLLAGVGVPLALLAWNLLHGRLALPAALVGVPMDLEAARRSHVWPMQEPDPARPGRLRWRYLRHVGSDAEARLDALAAAGVRRPWVTPKVPFMLPLLVGVAAWPAVAALLPWPT